MEEWQGGMSWPLAADWGCLYCGTRSLTWGFIYARCRCNECHAQYHMRDGKGEIVAVPISVIRPEYASAFALVWERHQIPIDEIGNAEWDRAFVELAAKE